MSPTRLLLYAATLALCSLLPAATTAHPATGIVVDAHGRVLEVGFTPPNVYSGPRVRELSPDGTLRILATAGLKENAAARVTSSEAACDAAAHEHKSGRLELALGLYFGLGLVAIGAVAGLTGFARRTGHA